MAVSRGSASRIFRGFVLTVALLCAGWLTGTASARLASLSHVGTEILRPEATLVLQHEHEVWVWGSDTCTIGSVRGGFDGYDCVNVPGGWTTVADIARAGCHWVARITVARYHDAPIVVHLGWVCRPSRAALAAVGLRGAGHVARADVVVSSRHRPS